MDQIEEYIRRILKVLIYIEENIDVDLSLKEIAKVASYSPFHFHRIFQGIVGETLHRYIKRLRIEKAAGKLRYTEVSITEIALDASYDTPSSFTKAFKQSMGSSPRSYRDLYSKTTQTIKALSMIHPDTIEKKLSDLPLLFIRRQGNYHQSPWDAWKSMNLIIQESNLDRMLLRFFGISHDDPSITHEENLRYDAAICTSQSIKTKGEAGHQILKGGKYAIFTHVGPYEKLEETFNKIFLKWLPTSAECFDETRAVFCEYFNMECIKTDPEKLSTKIYIPLK